MFSVVVTSRLDGARQPQGHGDGAMGYTVVGTRCTSEAHQLSKALTTRLRSWLSFGAIIVLALSLHRPALSGNRILLPADLCLLMPPWYSTTRLQYPDWHHAQNLMHGPLFEYYCWRSLSRSRIRAGEVPLWNPDELGGNVLLANSQSAVLYPPSALLYALPMALGWNALIIFHTWLTGLLMYGFLRSRGLARVGALAGAAGWMLGGWLVVWTEFLTPVHAVAWLPGVLWALERRAQTGQGRYIALAAVCLAMSLLAGHLQISFLVGLAGLVYAAVRAAQASGWRSLARAVALYGCAVAAACVLAGCTLLPVLEMARINYRSEGETRSPSALALPPVHLLTAVLPDLLGNPRDAMTMKGGMTVPWHPYWGKYDFIEYTFYGGVPAVVLALMALIARRKRKAECRTSLLPEIWIAAVGALLALGTPLHLLLYHLAPGYRQFHAPARAMCLFAFGLAAAAGYGVDYVARRRVDAGDGEARAVWLAPIVVLGLLIAAFPGTAPWLRVNLEPSWTPYVADQLRRGVLAWAATGGLLWAAWGGKAGARWRRAAVLALPALVAGDLLVWSDGFNPATDPGMLVADTPVLQTLARTRPSRVISVEDPQKAIKGMIVPNMNAVLGYREVQGADSMHSLRYHRVVKHVATLLTGRPDPFADPNTVRIPWGAHGLLDALNVRTLTTSSSSSPGQGWHLVQSGELTVWERSDTPGQAWLVTKMTVVPGLEAALAAMDSPVWRPGESAVTEGTGQAQSYRGGAAAVVMASPHRLSISVDSAGPGYLVVSETAMPGWHATVAASGTGAERRRIDVADGVLRGMSVPDGHSVVTMAYEPASYRVGLFLTVVGVLALFLLAGVLAVQTVTSHPLKSLSRS